MLQIRNLGNKQQDGRAESKLRLQKNTFEKIAKKRDAVLDIAKGIGIVLVVWGHTVCPITDYLYEFHMPFFFIVAGYFHQQNKPFDAFVVKKAERLLLPYLLFSIIAYLFYFGWSFLFNSGDFDYWKILKIIPLRDTVMAPLWFFIALFQVVIIFYLLNKNIAGQLLLLLVSLMISVLGYFLSVVQFNYFFVGSSFSMVFFYALGNIFLKAYRFKIVSNTGFKNLLLLLVCLVLFLVGSLYSTGVDIYRNYLKTSFPVYLINALSGSYLLLLISTVLNVKMFSILSFIGKNSMVIFAIHFPLLEVSKPIVSLIFNQGSYLWGTGVAIVCVVLSILASGILLKMFPKILKH